MQNNSENTAVDKAADFVQKHRKAIFSCLIVFVVLIAGSVVFLSLRDNFQRKAIAEVEELSSRFSELRLVLADENYAADADALLEDLNNFVKGKSGFAGSRGWGLIAQIHSGRKQWAEAEEAWLNAAKTGRKTYLGPVSFFNAAAAAEEQGKLREAVGYLENALSNSFAFPAAPRAQFSIGRLNEQLEDFPAALTAYRAVLSNWSNIEVWGNLAQSRILAIEAR